MQITNSSSYWQRITPQQTQKPEESQDFASRLSAEAPKTSIIQRQTQEFPQGLLQDIENLSKLLFNIERGMFDIDIDQKVSSCTCEDDSGNTNFMVGDYKYVVSKLDENTTLNELKNARNSNNHSTKNSIQDGAWLYDDVYAFWVNDDFDRTRYRPFSPHQIYDEASGELVSVEQEAFSEKLNRQPDMGYTQFDFENNLKKIEKLLEKHLLNEYKKDPRSDEAQQLLFLKAEINIISEVFEKDKQVILEKIQAGNGLGEAIFAHRDLWANETGMLAEFSLNLNKFLSEEEQQQVIESLQVILNYSDHHWFEGFGTQISSLFKNDNAMSAQLKASAQDFRENLVSRLSAIDNTETLLNLTSDSMNLQNNTKESKSYESLIDSIRAKLKTTDDSILQKLINGKTTNQAKATEVSA